ncbi:outer membrane lipoprotein-sorting protein [Erythrobacter dokdonensis]|uniref:Patched family protein n=1 Tax=Erythrobacter dokdonensis DSW-74 TaxID=1300349 RepID=A0A1A7BGH2_9SPHN|nr:outer membrane lipoprotein-sorting protein [Erythrobacter dokdonensis]OBV10826.1 Patched family protein [Erythrobacter dokdonensis DSW-74]
MHRIALIALSAVATASLSLGAAAQGTMTGDAIARNIAERPNADPRKGTITFVMQDKGRSRTRAARMLRTETGATHRLLLAFDTPASIRGTSFLSYDHKAASKVDETWLYLPATSRTRRVPASDRADSFMGTELSYGDVKDSFIFGLADWTFSAGGRADNGRYILKGAAKSARIAREIGYGGFTAEVDPATWFPRSITFTDPAGKRLKTISVRKLEKVGASLTATDFTVTNHVTGRATVVTVSGLAKATGADDALFDPARLDRASGRMP